MQPSRRPDVMLYLVSSAKARKTGELDNGYAAIYFAGELLSEVGQGPRGT